MERYGMSLPPGPKSRSRNEPEGTAKPDHVFKGLPPDALLRAADQAGE